MNKGLSVLTFNQDVQGTSKGANAPGAPGDEGGGEVVQLAGDGNAI